MNTQSSWWTPKSILTPMWVHILILSTLSTVSYAQNIEKKVDNPPPFDLESIVDQYYSASQPKDLQNALELLQQNAPTHPLRWEVEAHFNVLRLRTQHVSNLAIKSLEARLRLPLTNPLDLKKATYKPRGLPSGEAIS